MKANATLFRLLGPALGLVFFAGLLALVGHVVETPFPAIHVLWWLDPLGQPYLQLGEWLYGLTAWPQAWGLVGATLGVWALASGVLLYRNWREHSPQVALLTLTAAALCSQFLYWRMLPVAAYALAGGVFVAAMAASVTWRREPLRDLFPPPGPASRLALFGLLLLGAVFWRTYWLDAVPPGQAGHTMERGQDIIRVMSRFPLDWADPSTYPPAFYDRIINLRHWYGLSIFFDWLGFEIWGPSLLTQRMVTVVFGVLGVWVMILFAEKLFGTWAGLAAGFLMAVSPWNITHSRYSSVEHAISLLLNLLMAYLVVVAYKQRSLLAAMGAAAVMGLGFYAYTASQFAIFIMVAFWGYLVARKGGQRLSIALVGAVVILVALGLGHYKTFWFTEFSPRMLVNAPIGTHGAYGVRGMEGIVFNTTELLKGLFFQGLGGAWFWKNETAFLMYPVSALLLVGLGWCLPRVWDSRCVLLILTFFMGVAPTIPSSKAVPRRILAAQPAIYILAALALVLALRALHEAAGRQRFPTAKRCLLALGLFLGSAAALHTIWEHVQVYEVTLNTNGIKRRLGEVTAHYAPDHYPYLFFPPFGHDMVVFIFTSKDVQTEEPDYAFFSRNSLLTEILPRPKTGPEGAVFILPDNDESQGMEDILRTLYPTGELRYHRYDWQYRDHSQGEPYARAYIVPAEDIATETGMTVRLSGPGRDTDEEPLLVESLADIQASITDEASIEAIWHGPEALAGRLTVVGAELLEATLNGRDLATEVTMQGHQTEMLTLPAGLHRLSLHVGRMRESVALTFSLPDNTSLKPRLFSNVDEGILTLFGPRQNDTFPGTVTPAGTLILPELEQPPLWAATLPLAGQPHFLDRRSKRLYRLNGDSLEFLREIPEVGGITDFAVRADGELAVTHDEHTNMMVLRPDGAVEHARKLHPGGTAAYFGDGHLIASSALERRSWLMLPDLSSVHYYGYQNPAQGKLSGALDTATANKDTIAILDTTGEMMLFGQGTALKQSFFTPARPHEDHPPQMAFDEAGNAFITDYELGRVHWLRVGGRHHVGPNGESGIAVGQPVAVVASGGMLSVADANGIVHRFSYAVGEALPE